MRKISFNLFLILIIFGLFFSGCEKDNPEAVNVIIEEAFPGETGDKVELILNGSPITCEIIQGKMVFQGDIILTEEQVDESSRKGAALSESVIHRWTENTIVYSINNNVPDKDKILEARKHWADKTFVKFKLRTNEENYVEFVNSDGCSSNLGMIGGRQEIQIADWAVIGNIIHEIGHTYGLIHEHSRPDRDNYIVVKEDNIIEAKDHNFQIYPQSINTSTFDFGSIMIYSSRNSYGINSDLPTMTKIDGKEWVAQREELSRDDIKMIDDLRYGSFDDLRDGHEYKTIQIGDQVWMAENLAFLPLVSGSDEYSITNQHYYVYGYQGNNISDAKNSDNFEKYGVLYNWEASRTACPDDWHLPTDDEWRTLALYLGLSPSEWENLWGLTGEVGKKLKSSLDWRYNKGDNSSGFNAYPGGFLSYLPDYPAKFLYINELAYFWSSTPYISTHAWSTCLSYMDAGIHRHRRQRVDGYSIRCLKD